MNTEEENRLASDSDSSERSYRSEELSSELSDWDRDDENPKETSKFEREQQARMNEAVMS